MVNLLIENMHPGSSEISQNLSFEIFFLSIHVQEEVLIEINFKVCLQVM
jgi:hypothetical protein